MAIHGIKSLTLIAAPQLVSAELLPPVTDRSPNAQAGDNVCYLAYDSSAREVQRFSLYLFFKSANAADSLVVDHGSRFNLN